MAIRLRRVNGRLIALCAAETDAAPGDVYLDDEQHGALAAKFWRDYRGETISYRDEEADLLAATQRLRDGKETLLAWLREGGYGFNA